jgi:dimethylargininase
MQPCLAAVAGPSRKKQSMQCTRAIVRPPSLNLADGLTTASLGSPNPALALSQHAAYCAALVACGVDVIELPVDPRHPDATFIEDTAVLTARGAMLTRPGAPSRQGEIEDIRGVLISLFGKVAAIEPPGTLDGGDVCEVDDHFFIGVSHRTNSAGARQLADWLFDRGYAASVVDLRGTPLLHLKSGLSYLGQMRLLVIEAIAGFPLFSEFERLRVPQGEEYAANSISINGRLLVPQGFADVERLLRDGGSTLVALEMSEFRKMDGGVSCLSLRM